LGGGAFKEGGGPGKKGVRGQKKRKKREIKKRAPFFS